jgi:hypothetical protein
MPAMSGPPGREDDPARRAAEAIAGALRGAPFDTQQSGDLFLRATAERAIKGALGEGTRVALAGRDGAQVGAVALLGGRFTPDLVVEAPGGARVAVTVTLLRGNGAPVAGALATALVLAAAPRYGAVVVFLLDRRLGKRDPFADPAEAPAPVRGLNETERAFLDRLWRLHGVRVEVRRQDPFGWE